MTRTDADAVMMRRALRLASRGAGQVSPNPKVGAVIVRDGTIVGEGWHRRYGEAHAEVNALHAAGDAARGATAYVTLEPCNHIGKTPPCTRALAAAGVARVVYAVADPNPIAAGGGEWLRAQGIEVTGGVLHDEAAELNAPFLFRAVDGTRPFVTLKLAMSIDGAIARGGPSRTWLTGPRAQRMVHLLRADADAVAIGIGTAIADDPLLTVRGVPAPARPPVRVVFDRDARLAADSALVRTASEAPVTVVTAGRAVGREQALARLGVTILPAAGLMEAMGALRRSGVGHVFVEGGATLASALLGAGLVDRLITFQAPLVLGAGSLSAFAAFDGGGEPSRWRVVARRAFGPDLMTVYAPQPPDRGR